MTGLLKDLMSDKADQAAAPRLDIDAIVADGDKRVHRRRIVAGTGVAAVAAAVVTAFAVVPGIVDNSGPDPTHPPVTSDFSSERITYADGSMIRYGAETFDVSPLEVKSLVRTDRGFVFVAGDRHVYFTTGGKAEQLDGVVQPGGGDVPSLVASGPYAAWMDRTGPSPELVVYNTAERAEVIRTSDDTSGADDARSKSAVQAMDGSQLYWHNATGVVVTDVSATDSEPILLLPNASTEWLYDVVDGVFARSSFDDLTVTVSRDVDAQGPNFPGAFGILSPDASYVAAIGEMQLRVFDIQSRESVTRGSAVPIPPVHAMAR